MARTTPAQKPRGRNRIIFFTAADIGVEDIGVPHYNNPGPPDEPPCRIKKYSCASDFENYRHNQRPARGLFVQIPLQIQPNLLLHYAPVAPLLGRRGFE